MNNLSVALLPFGSAWLMERNFWPAHWLQPGLFDPSIRMSLFAEVGRLRSRCATYPLIDRDAAPARDFQEGISLDIVSDHG